ncbi:hypothetical protein ACFJGW_00530 [Burkholderiaceae bacterium UC74_6]
MALIKPYQTPGRAEGEYHRIRKYEVDCDAKILTVAVGVYRDKQARDDGCPPLWHEYVVLPFSALVADARDQVYPLLTCAGASYLKNAIADEQSNAAPAVLALTLAAMEDPVPPNPEEGVPQP